MRLVMLRIEDLAVVSQLFVEAAIDVELFLDPKRTGKQVGPESTRHYPKVCLENPLELEQWLVVKADVVQLIGAKARFPEAVLNRMDRKRLVVLLARESLLLCGSHDLTVDNQRGGGIVIEG